MSDFEGAVEGFDTDYDYKGARFGPPFFLDPIQKCENFKFDPSDVVLAAYPKTGNTWVEEIIWLIGNNADVEASSKKHIMERFPLMELKYGEAPAFVEMLAQAPSPRYCNTHLPYNIMEKTLEESKPKVVILMRNPKDQLVSFFHFYNSYPGRKVEKFSDFFKLFSEGRLAFGNYIDHAALWYQQRNKPNMFFITYEELKADHYGSVERLAKFLEKDLSPEQLQIITDATSMSSMKKRGVSKGGSDSTKKEEKLDDKSFFRKGIVGDWKNVFTKEQSDTVENICREKLEPLGLKFQWE